MYFEKTIDNETWACAYDRAIRPDGSLLFPQKLSKDYLARQRKIQGPYIFASQYQNEIVPSEDQDFKKEWLVYYKELPTVKHTFAMIDPAISLDQAACYTALTIIDVDVNNQWYLKVARRVRITATQTINLIFDIHKIYNCQVIGVETVAYQMAILHFLKDEMQKRGITIPVHGVNRGPDKSKMMRIRSLVPRFENQGILVKPGLTEFEDEYSKFPRGSYVDILDALSSIEEFSYKPAPRKEFETAPTPNSPKYEQWYRKQLRETDNEQD
jgi:predicted phage terminase large subunit-like protein